MPATGREQCLSVDILENVYLADCDREEVIAMQHVLASFVQLIVRLRNVDAFTAVRVVDKRTAVFSG